jgi:hypothetical protein
VYIDKRLNEIKVLIRVNKENSEQAQFKIDASYVLKDEEVTFICETIDTILLKLEIFRKICQGIGEQKEPEDDRSNIQESNVQFNPYFV